MDWFDNDDLFLRECAEGHRWERYVAELLRRKGVDAACLKQELRAHVSEAPSYLTDSDVVVTLASGRQLVFEVKSRRVFFNGPRDFPDEDIFVDTVSGWEGKDPKPAAVICISQLTKRVIVLATATQPQWRQERRRDRVRDIETTFYAAPRELWAPLGALVRRLEVLNASDAG